VKSLKIKTLRTTILNPALTTVASTSWNFKVRSFAGQDSAINSIDATVVSNANIIYIKDDVPLTSGITYIDSYADPTL